MIRRPNSAAAQEPDSEFHAVAWVRGVRDQMYETTSALSAEELIEFVRKAAVASSSGHDQASSKGTATSHDAAVDE